MASHPEPDVALTRQLIPVPNSQQRLLERFPLIGSEQPHVNHRHFSLQLDGAAVRPGDFQLGVRMVPARCCPGAVPQGPLNGLRVAGPTLSNIEKSGLPEGRGSRRNVSTTMRQPVFEIKLGL